MRPDTAPTSVAIATSPAARRPMTATHALLRWLAFVVDGGIVLILGLMIGQAVIQSGQFPTRAALAQTAIWQWAMRQPVLAVPLAVIVLLMGLGAPLLERRLARQRRARAPGSVAPLGLPVRPTRPSPAAPSPTCMPTAPR